MEGFEALLTGTVGAVGVLIAVIIAIMSGRLVPGPTHDRLTQQFDRVLASHEKAVEVLGRVTPILEELEHDRKVNADRRRAST